MTGRESIFSEDWRDSLRVHYMDVVRRNDTATEKTLIGVMHDVGFRDEELRELKLQATMRAEDLQGDFVPVLDLPPEKPTLFQGVDVEPTPEEEPMLTDARYVAGELVNEEETKENTTVETKEQQSSEDDDADLPQQMSMF